MKSSFYFGKSQLAVLICFLAFFVFSQKINAAPYYFSSTEGDDSRTAVQAQNPATPWRSLSRLASFFPSLQAGDVIYFKRGDVFFGSINVTRSGISFNAYGTGSNPIISGFQNLTFTSIGSNLWESNSVTVRPNTLTYNGNYQAPGRFPNTGYLTHEGSNGTNQITDNQLTGNWVGGELCVRKNNWISDKGIITSQSGTTLTYQNISGDWHTNGWGYFLQNHPMALDQNGDWYYNSSNQRIVLFSTVTPGPVKVSNIARLVQLNNNSASFSNIDFEGANDFTFHITNSNSTSVTNSTIQFSGSFAFYANGSANLRVEGCNISYSNNEAFLIQGSPNSIIRNNTINYTGIEGAGQGLNVTNLEYSAISISGSDGTIISGNSISNTGYNAIHFLFGNNYTIQNNFINRFNTVKDDGSAIYTWNGNGSPANYTGSKIIGNVILNGTAATGSRNNPSYTPAYGIYMDDNAAGVAIIGNTIADCAGSGIYIHNAHDLVIRGNTVYNCGSATADPASVGQMQFLGDGGSFLIRNVSMFDNVFVSKFARQIVLKWDTNFNDILLFGSADSNYYARPIDDNLMARIVATGTNPFYTLASWKTYSGKDPNSKKSPRTVTSVDSLRFVYNETSVPKVISLGATYIDIRGNSHSGSITLQPNTSAVLIYRSGTIINQAPTVNAGANQTITLPTNSVTLTGSGTDADGNIASFQWSRIAGPTSFTIVAPGSAQTTINNLVQGTYSFELRVTDNLGAIGRDTVLVTVNPAPNQAPTANAGVNQTITLPTNSVTLTGSGTDADGSIASFQWSRIAGPTSFTIVSATSAQTTINNLVQGTYSFELRVTDNAGAIGRDTVVVTVNPAPNQAPTANAGTNQTITLPTNSVTLTGSGNDADGTIASFQWSRIAGPTSFTIVSPSSAQTIINNLVQGTYSFELRVTDNAGAIGRDTVFVTVNPAPNQAPTANAGANQAIVLPVNNVTLTGSGNDVDGTIISYQWTKVSGPAVFNITSPASQQTTVTNLQYGVYGFELRVTDNSGAVGRDTVLIVVNSAPNQAPTASAGSDRTITLPTNSVTLTGSGNDADGTIASFQWSRIAGSTSFTIVSANSAQTAINNLVQGTYSFELRVTDNAGAVGRDTVFVTVNPAPNPPPVANAGLNKTITLPVNSVVLNGTATDANGMIASYLWTKIAGPATFTIVSPTSAQTTVNNLIQGTYSFELRATDNQGAIGRDTVMVTVNPAPNQAPTANAGANQAIVLPANSVTLNGSGNDVDGTIVSYQWTKVSGPAVFNITSPSSQQTTVTNLQYGVYGFELRVTDNSGAIGRDTVLIVVNSAPNQAPTANAGSNRTITLPTNSVTLTGSGNDADGTIASFQWSRITGPTSFTIVSPSSAQTTINNLVQGTYSFELRVTDNAGAVGRDTVFVTVNPAPNQAPTANAGANQTITLPTNSVTLTGSGNDADGTIASFQWSRITGPTSFTIVSANSAQTAINNLVQGTYSFELRVTDNQGATGRDTVLITVNPLFNQLPVANAGPDISIVLPVNGVKLTGSATDVDGTIQSYLWTKVSGPDAYTILNVQQAATVIENLVSGIYRFELKVTDNKGGVGRDTVMIDVQDATKTRTRLFPNPTTSAVTLEIPMSKSETSAKIKVFDGTGLVLYYKVANKIQNRISTQIDVSRFINGVYFIEIDISTTRKELIRFIKQ
jgi:parallel beta-helix repeat protein